MSRDSGSTLSRRGGAKENLREKVESLIINTKWGETAFSGDEGQGTGLSLSRSIDLPVSAYVLFQKDPAEFWRAYQIGWTVGENEWAGEDAIFNEYDFSAADFGTAMHGFFEHLDFEKPERFLKPEMLERAFGRFGKDAIGHARTIIRDFMKQPVFHELRKARQVKREVDFVLNERRGLIHGKIDILFEDEKGEWHILDYKTAAGDADAARKSAYDLQLEIYALAAERILKLPVRSVTIYYLKNQKAVVLPFPAASLEAFFDGLEKKICALQQQILDCSNEQMTKVRHFSDDPFDRGM
jgi:hypothetical protein